eukprot:g3249.t1
MGNAASGLPYTLADPVPSYTDKQGWTMYDAATKSDKAPCTIFKFDAKSGAGNKAAAQNALKSSKMFKHPNIVRCLDGIESPAGDVLVVTEPVVPLLDWLTEMKASAPSPESFAESVTMGLAGVVRAVSFLSNDVGVVHGLLCPDAVFVTKGGDWKLSRFDLAGHVDAAFLDRQRMLMSPYACPARASSDRSVLRNMPLHAIDAWSLGVLIHTIYCGEAARREQLQQTSKIPRGLKQAYQKLLKSVPEQRINPSRIVNLRHFSTPLVESMLFLDEIMIKTPQEKHAFFESLSDAIDSFPRHVCKYKVLPALTASLSLGATSGETSMGVSGPVVLVPLLKLGTMLDEDEFENHIVPVLVTMFEQQDRGIRVALLSRMPALVESIDRKLINEKIFGCVCTGFSDTAPAMREMTLKSLPTLAPKLDEKTIEGQMKSVLVRMLQDPVPAIRTNATVCLGLLAHYFTPKTLSAVCIPGFTRALRDNFPHNRERALHSIKAVAHLLNPTDLATKVMPHVCPSLVDSVLSVRDSAQECVCALAERLEANSGKMKAEAEAKQKELEKATGIGSTTASAANANASSGTVGWMASAAVAGATSLTSKFIAGKAEGGRNRGRSSATESENQSSLRGSESLNRDNSGRSTRASSIDRRAKPHVYPNQSMSQKMKISSSPRDKAQSEDLDDFFGGWGDEEDDDALFGSSGGKSRTPPKKRSTSKKAPAKASTASNVGGRRMPSLSKSNRSITKKPVRNLSLRNEDPKDLMDDSWGQDNADLDELLGGLSSPQEGLKAHGKPRANKKKAKNSSLLGLKTKKVSSRKISSNLKKGKQTTQKAQNDLFEEFGF